MTAPKSLPPRPSLDSLRKQAKKLARERALSQRDAQLVLAREYGFSGWQDLIAEVSKRLGNGLDWAAAQARHVIHDNDVERLKKLLAEYPALLSWQGGGWRRPARNGHGRLWRRGRPGERKMLHPRGVRRAADRRRRGRDAVCVRGPHPARARGCCSCFSAKTCCRTRLGSLPRLAISTLCAGAR